MKYEGLRRLQRVQRLDVIAQELLFGRLAHVLPGQERLQHLHNLVVRLVREVGGVEKAVLANHREGQGQNLPLRQLRMEIDGMVPDLLRS